MYTVCRHFRLIKTKNLIYFHKPFTGERYFFAMFLLFPLVFSSQFL
ncbi:hypothetical protein SAMN05216378_0533 [Paenibacillus catalpae]|uniref:Uncharacterized protein n=1 Tax=Paenibacillus catalpae TaxID=1045775 RepID=A0A1I1TIW8_9BACL|nr:hypothetical protein SAMN05216378_0533 [Paenibacillus catalpae]